MVELVCARLVVAWMENAAWIARRDCDLHPAFSVLRLERIGVNQVNYL